MDPGERRWLFGGAALLLAAGSFTAVRVLDSDSAPAAQSAARPVPERPIAAERFGGNLPGSPTVARVARDGRVWVLLRRRGHTSLARLEGRLLREVPLGEEPPTWSRATRAPRISRIPHPGASACWAPRVVSWPEPPCRESPTT